MATSDCVELTVLNDNLFERTEDLTGSLGEIIVGGMTFQTLPRVTLRPVQTTIDIEDTDGKCLCVPSCVSWACLCVPVHFDP